MQRLSPASLINAVGEPSSQGSPLTPQRGSTEGVGLTSGTPAARAWLLDRTPAQVDADLVASLARSLEVNLRTEREWRFPEGKPAYSVTTVTGATAPSRANLDRAIQRVETAMTPVLRHEAETMIAQMSVATASRADDDDVSDLKLDMFVRCLMSHPADVAAAAVRRFSVEPRADGGTAWFPTLPELEGACRQLSGDRLSMLQGLRSWSEPSAQAQEVARLYSAYVDLREQAREANNKVGAGPVTDTGPRGERIEAARLLNEKMIAAKEAWVTAQK